MVTSTNEPNRNSDCNDLHTGHEGPESSSEPTTRNGMNDDQDENKMQASGGVGECSSDKRKTKPLYDDEEASNQQSLVNQWSRSLYMITKKNISCLFIDLFLYVVINGPIYERDEENRDIGRFKIWCSKRWRVCSLK